MKEYIADLVRASPTVGQALNQVREYLQARILDSLQSAGGMIPLAFHGGTALRFLYVTPRYSEDLDFVLERDEAQYDLPRYLSAIEAHLRAEGYVVRTGMSEQKAVQSASIRFPGLMYELGLSPHTDEVLWIKIEVDTNPPAGAVLATTVVRRHVTLHLQHHDRASLLAGKLHAILHRPYTKGRDIHDLLWYLSDPDWPEPNLTLLNNALRQTEWSGPDLTERNWRELVGRRLDAVVWGRVIPDVEPFLAPSGNVRLLTRENLMRLLRQSPGGRTRR
ncbi:MAG: hypothetical protein CEE40_12595 [Chloroflexi bacterium B3_Chlor]|nr:MAG: hypothetical protein CEE40_12595 [Chloroflexi bacterium B3_Chlor]